MCYSKCGSRLGAAHIRFNSLQQLHGLRGMLLEMWLSPGRRVHSFQKFATVTRTEGVCYSKCGSRLSAAHTRLKHLQFGFRILFGAKNRIREGCQKFI